MNIKTAFFAFLFVTLAASAAEHDHWVVSWGASPSPQLADEAQMRSAKLVFENQTLREIVHVSIGGQTVRVRLSNAFGREAVDIGAAHIGLRSNGTEVASGSDRALTFSGRPTVSIPPNGLVLSDPVNLDLPVAGDAAVSLYIPKSAMGAGIHYSAEQTSYIGPGNLTGSASIPDPSTIKSWVFLASLDVVAPKAASTLAAFGDSITDGARSTLDANSRWPNILAGRLLAKGHAKQIGILDAGIGGNRILHDASTNIQFGVSALARFDRDVLAQPGIRFVIVLEGINDLGHASPPSPEVVSAEDIVAGLKQLVERAHENGLKIFGATLTPFVGTPFPGYFSPEKEAMRKAVNQWIRTSEAFDGVIDFEKALQDPQNPDHLLPAYDSGDHLHPNDAGYRAMGKAIDLSLFK